MENCLFWPSPETTPRPLPPKTIDMVAQEVSAVLKNVCLWFTISIIPI